MWCKHCQQDVPAVASRAGGPVVCARCHYQLTVSQPAHVTGILDNGIELDEQPTCDPVDPLEKLSSWQTDQKLRRIGRALKNGPQAAGSITQVASAGTPHVRFDLPQNLITSGQQQSPNSVNSKLTAPQAKTGSLQAQAFAWLMVATGMITFGGGVGLGVWSVVQNLPEYHEVCIALVLLGQGLLIVGLVQVVSRLWRNSRYSTSKLQEVHWQLTEVQRTAQTILGTKNSSAPAFYAELSRGASTPMLLASLKGQLDQLAVRVQGES